VLYTVFEWPVTHPEGVVLVGIANALDLTDRTLPRLRARKDLAPKLLHFAPYSREQIVNILKLRLEEVCSSFFLKIYVLKLGVYGS